MGVLFAKRWPVCQRVTIVVLAAARVNRETIAALFKVQANLVLFGKTAAWVSLFRGKHSESWLIETYIIYN